MRRQRCRLPTEIPCRAQYTSWVRPLRAQPATNRCHSLRLRCRQPMMPLLSHWIGQHHRTRAGTAEECIWRDAYAAPGRSPAVPAVGRLAWNALVPGRWHPPVRGSRRTRTEWRSPYVRSSNISPLSASSGFFLRRYVRLLRCSGGRRLRQLRADGIQIHIGHRGQHRLLVQPGLALEPALPEAVTLSSAFACRRSRSARA
jgi:hypothetical protein